MKLRDQIKKLPEGAVISVEPTSMTLVRYHARGCRDIVTRSNLKTGKRDVLLGAFYRSKSMNEPTTCGAAVRSSDLLGV